MIAESMATHFLNNSLPGSQLPVEAGYFRSKLLVTDTFTNPLIAAASPLLSILERLHFAQELPPVENLQQDIAHEFKAFNSRCQSHDYSEEFRLLAHYLLSATTDEILGKTYLRLQGEVQNFKAFTPISHTGIGPEQYFFDIVTQLMSTSEQFLDLIELAYFCLLIGFEGKYHLQAEGRTRLDNLIEQLFHTIQKYRSNRKHKLFKTYVLKNQTSKRRLSTGKIMGMAMGTLIGLGILSQIIIQQQMSRIISKHQILMENS